MAVPVVRGVIERRLLVNYRVDLDVAAHLVPEPFRPQIVDGSAVAGICLIRLGALRPRGLPSAVGLTTENAAHRIAVTWDDHGTERAGVYIPLRHTSSRVTALVGDRLFPGAHSHATFDVDEHERDLDVRLVERDGGLTAVDVEIVDPPGRFSSLFPSVDHASDFFRSSPTGYSPRRDGVRAGGLELRTHRWSIEAARARSVASAFYDDPARFPRGSIELDSVLVMRDVGADWVPAGSVDVVSGQPA